MGSRNKSILMAESGLRSSVQQQLEEVVVIMSDNVDKVMQRGENLDNMDQRADQLLLNSAQFERRSNQMRRKMMIRNMKGWALLVLICAGLLSIVIYLVTDHEKNPGDGN